MSDENAKCPDCEDGWLHGQIRDCGICSVRCQTCKGTGRNTARAGVTCTALVGECERRYEALERRRKALNNTLNELKKISDEMENEALELSAEISAAKSPTSDSATKKT